MTLDRTETLTDYASLHPLIPAAAKFLSRPDLADLPDGRYEIQGEEVYAMIMRAPGKAEKEAKLEAHNRYIDVQALLSGEEAIGYRLRATCTQPIDEYDQEKDIIFFEDDSDGWIPVKSGQFAIFLPHDAHAPMVSTGDLHKVVVKLAL